MQLNMMKDNGIYNQQDNLFDNNVQDFKQVQPPLQKKSTVVENIERMQKQREERRAKMEEQKAHKKERELLNQAQGKLVDADFDIMVDKFRLG